MVLKLYGGMAPIGATASVAMTLAEKQIPFEFVFVDMASGAHKSADYLAMQPFGLVPVIDDNGFVLYESRAICRYLAEKYAAQGTPLVPTELKARALFEQAASVELANFQPLARGVYDQGISKTRRGLEIDQEAMSKLVSALSATLDVYEAILGKQKYLAGDELTLVDIFHLGFGSILYRSGCDLMTTKGPNVARWWNDLLSRPSWVGLQEGVKSTIVV
ncbi:glutathione S-transferase [Mycena latifolia]|nr:glutathione S-transferase [Mycena latifolia]